MISVCRTVCYTISKTDAEQVSRRRTTGPEIAARIKTGEWPLGAQAHVGATIVEGDVFPLVVVRVDSGLNTVNGQVLLDGNDVLYVVGVKEHLGKGGRAGCWHWPARD